MVSVLAKKYRKRIGLCLCLVTLAAQHDAKRGRRPRIGVL